MTFIDTILGRYQTHPEAAIVSCYFNPTKSPYRRAAYDKFYSTIKHMNHRIVECAIGDDPFEIPKTENIRQVRTKTLLWHKESLLNMAIKDLPQEIKYVFWIDADVIFTNKRWMKDGVRAFKNGAKILQPFEYCIHLDKGETRPGFDVDEAEQTCSIKELRNPKMWRSFSANYADDLYWKDEDYNVHGHVGFAWGATRDVAEFGLFDRGLVGGADHIMAHAAAGQINHPCITKAFNNDLKIIEEWSKRFSKIVDGKIDFVEGDIHHIWHGDLEKRQYLKRIKDFDKMSPGIQNKDHNGLYTTNDPTATDYVMNYFLTREVVDAMTSTDTPADTTDTFQGFGGGESGGAGASGSWDSPQTPDTTVNENFS